MTSATLGFVFLVFGSLPATASANTWCDSCAVIVKQVEDNGCKALPVICAALPAPANVICSLLTVGGVCDDFVAKIKAKHDTPEEACEYLGYCGSPCQCGVCTAELAGPNGRCLGIPNSCGHEVSTSTRYNLSTSPSADIPTPPKNFCLHGQCDGPDHYGCCLTCFMSTNSISV